jgi:peptide deformylase
MKRKFFLLSIPAIILVLLSYQCKKDAETPLVKTDTLALTQIEKDSILKGDTNDVMRILTIFNYDDSLILRKESHEVRADPNDTVLFRLARRMYYTLKATGSGVGIAGPQVGINRDIIWVQRLDKTGKPFECYLNPKIDLYSNKAVVFNGDGCLSIPGTYGNSHRFSSVVVEYDKLDGTHHQEIIEGYGGTNFTAIIFQHEIDHLHGVLFIDKLNKGKLSQPAPLEIKGKYLM